LEGEFSADSLRPVPQAAGGQPATRSRGNNQGERLRGRMKNMEMRLVAIGSEVQGRVRAVYTDDDGDEYVVISDERIYLDPE
jgi:hypothetical protein